MNRNKILEKIRNHQTAYVLSIKSENLDAIEYAAKLNYDAIHLDAEHGSFSVDSVERVCQLAISSGLTVTSRVHKISKQEINLFIQLVQRAYAHGLDGGALEGLHGQTEALRLSLMVGRLPELRALGCVTVGAR